MSPITEHTEILTLPAPPALGVQFLASALRSKPAGDTLPDVAARVVGHHVDRAHLAAYQRLCGFDVSDRLPHTYPHVVAFGLQGTLMSRPDFPFPLAGLVHLENTITVHRPLVVSDALTLTMSSDNLRAHAKGRVVDLVAQVHVGDDLAWSSRSSYLARGAGDPQASRGTGRPGIPRGEANARWRLDGDLGRRYAAVSGDVNPIHLTALTAKAMGFPRAIAHGMWTYARTIGALGVAAQGPCTSRVWFVKPVLLPGSVDLVLDTPRGQVLTAGLRSTRSPDTEHLVLTLTR